MAGFNIPHVILQPLQQEVGYKTEQIIPVSLYQRTPLGLAVLNTSPYKTLQELIDYRQRRIRAPSLWAVQEPSPVTIWLRSGLKS